MENLENSTPENVDMNNDTKNTSPSGQETLNSNIGSTEGNSFSNSTYDEDMKKYTEIDNLDEDPGEQQFVLLSFVSPENIMNCNVRALKIRNFRGKPAFFRDYTKACEAAKLLNDKYHNVFVGECGKWIPFDPRTDDRDFVESEKWSNKDEQNIMDGLERSKREMELAKKRNDEMNALVGKHKAIIDHEHAEHKTRVAETIKQGIRERDEPKKPLPSNQDKPQPKSSQRDTSTIKDRMRRKLAIKKQNKEQEEERHLNSEINNLEKSQFRTETPAPISNDKVATNLEKLSSFIDKL